MLVVASICSEGLLGMEALQLCLPHQLNFRMGHLWVDGQSTLQLHQQRQVVWASAHIKGSLVMPPDSEIVAPVSFRSRQEFHRVLIEPDIMESYGVVPWLTRRIGLQVYY